MASAAPLSPGFWASGLIILDRKILTVSLSQTDKYEHVIKIIYQKKCSILQLLCAICLWKMLVVLLVDIEILLTKEQW